MSHHGHRQRLRSRFENTPESLADYEVLEMLLGYVLLRKDTKPIAKDMLARFGSLRGVLHARKDELESLESVGPGVSTFLAICREFTARAAESSLRLKESLCSPEEVAHMARQRLGSLPHEEIWMAFVDSQNRLIQWERMAKGTVNATSIYPRDILERALAVKATGFIMVHNHPGGLASPSGADHDITQRVQEAARALNIRFIDHVIVTDTLCYSIMTDGIIL